MSSNPKRRKSNTSQVSKTNNITNTTDSTEIADSKMAGRKAIKTALAPGNIAPYSQAMYANNLLFISGQLGMTAEGKFEATDAAGQTVQSLKNVGILLKEAGLDYNNVVKTTVLMSDINDYPAINAEYDKFFSDPKPARSAFAVAALPKHPESKVEIEVIALKE